MARIADGEMSDLGELGRLEIALYRRALTNPSNSLADLARDLECTTEELDKPAKRLAEMGLFRIEQLDRVVALSPMLAEATVLGAEDLELNARRASVEIRRDSIRQLVGDWNDAFATR